MVAKPLVRLRDELLHEFQSEIENEKEASSGATKVKKVREVIVATCHHFAHVQCPPTYRLQCPLTCGMYCPPVCRLQCPRRVVQDDAHCSRYVGGHWTCARCASSCTPVGIILHTPCSIVLVARLLFWGSQRTKRPSALEPDRRHTARQHPTPRERRLVPTESV